MHLDVSWWNQKTCTRAILAKLHIHIITQYPPSCCCLLVCVQVLRGISNVISPVNWREMSSRYLPPQPMDDLAPWRRTAVLPIWSHVHHHYHHRWWRDQSRTFKHLILRNLWTLSDYQETKRLVGSFKWNEIQQEETSPEGLAFYRDKRVRSELWKLKSTCYKPWHI